ncbi:BCD family MFS transporter [Gemmatimonas phototrophica]|uniref:Protein pucC n=1 Tax=Gemmatimonas phototrophica TaxID=1379270 RepID=A0A143BJC1_9BACT|nr:BCD family MFS transporter [Gemmatimonas phototrophica]AMW04580.1 protein pucC [Gemmatimonas phototrophica]
MASASDKIVSLWRSVGSEWLPFADVATNDVPLSRLLRLSLFQLSVGMVQTLFVGTLNRVMILELRVPASLVAIMLAIPLLVAPFRALVGFKSDTHKSILGWKRVPYLWLGTQMQFGGLAIMPFALLVLSEGGGRAPLWVAYAGTGLAFLLVGAGAHTTQTAGLALATDIVKEDKRPRVIALMYLMMLMGTLVSALVLERLLQGFTPFKLIQVIQGTAVFTVICNAFSLWKQEVRVRGVVEYKKGERRPMFSEAWRTFSEGGQAVRLLIASGLGFFAFNLQDVLLEPYGGEILKFTVAETTALTAIMAFGAVIAFAWAANVMRADTDPVKMASHGVIVGVIGFSLIAAASVSHSAFLFRVGVMLIGFGEGLFGVGTLSFAMNIRDASQHGIALGAWGAVFATAEGLSFAVSGIAKDWLSHLIGRGALGPGITSAAAPYTMVYVTEIVVLLATLVPLLTLTRREPGPDAVDSSRTFGLADIPA